MFDKSRLISILNLIENSINLICSQRTNIASPKDFVSSQQGMFILGGICMQLVFIGENIKVIDNKTEHKYLTRYPEIQWIEIMGLRNLIAHEYHKVDEDEIFNIIFSDLDTLHNSIIKMRQDLL